MDPEQGDFSKPGSIPQDDAWQLNAEFVNWIT
jgi:hypothetical protein